MFQKVIYKRQYNKPTIEEIEAEIADEPIPAEVKDPLRQKINVHHRTYSNSSMRAQFMCHSLSGNLSPRHLSVKPSKYQRTTKLTLKSDKVPGQSR